jgi:hypothetical protein
MNKNFITLSAHQSHSLYQSIFKNSQNMQKDAVFIAEASKFYSKATSLI